MKILRAQQPHLELRPKELPSLITFDDINDPHSALAIDPLHVEDTLGPGISWNAMTIDVVDPQPLVFDLDKKLPWVTELRERSNKTDASSMYGLSFKGISVSSNSLTFYDFEHRR